MDKRGIALSREREFLDKDYQLTIGEALQIRIITIV